MRFGQLLTRASFGVLVLLGGCTKPGETTAVGAAAGGVIGAGLGAVVGNQTGDAGTGALLGAVAGSATGAVVGNALQAQDEAIKTQGEAIEKQQQIIAAQRGEIQELTRLSQDQVTFKPKGSKVSHKKSAAQVKLRPPNPSSARAAFKPSANVAAANKNSAALPAKSATTVAAGSSGFKERNISGTVAPTFAQKFPEPPSPALKYDRNEDPDGESSSYGVEPEDSFARGSFGWNGSGNSYDNEGGNSEGLSAECLKAEEEVNRIHPDMESADKLFHYRRALRLCPENASYHNGLGEVYLALNRKQDAEFEFKEALKVDSNHRQARKNLSSLAK